MHRVIRGLTSACCGGRQRSPPPVSEEKGDKELPAGLRQRVPLKGLPSRWPCWVSNTDLTVRPAFHVAGPNEVVTHLGLRWTARSGRPWAVTLRR